MGSPPVRVCVFLMDERSLCIDVWYYGVDWNGYGSIDCCGNASQAEDQPRNIPQNMAELPAHPSRNRGRFALSPFFMGR